LGAALLLCPSAITDRTTTASVKGANLLFIGKFELLGSHFRE
jgi:hypothetical protein